MPSYNNYENVAWNDPGSTYDYSRMLYEAQRQQLLGQGAAMAVLADVNPNGRTAQQTLEERLGAREPDKRLLLL